MAGARTFTSYINAALDPQAEQTFDRLANRGVQAYGAIARAALGAELATKRATSAAAAGGRLPVTSIRSAAGLQGGGRSTAGITAAVGAANTRALNQVARAQDSAARGLDRYANATGRAQKNQTAFTNSLRATATTLQIAQGPLGPLAGRVTAVANALENLTGFRLGVAGVGTALFALGRAGVAFTNVESRLKPLYNTQTQVNAALEDVVGIANRARTSLAPVVDLFVKITSAGEGVGISAQRAARVTELASKAAILSGGSRQAQEAGLTQFSQGIGSGQLAGEELKSVRENTFELAAQIAKGFQNADGSIGTTSDNLRKLAEEGKLTSEAVASALERSAARIEEKFAKMPLTLGQSIAQFTNNVTVMVGQLDSALGVTSGVAQVIAAIGNNLRLVAAIAIGAGAAFTAIKVGPLIAGAAALAQQTKKTLEFPAAVNRVAQARKVAAAESLAQHRREVDALEGERRQTLKNIETLERQRKVASRDVQRASSGPNPSDRRVTAAIAEERRAIRGLAQERQRLAIVGGALTGANERVRGSTTRLDVATRNASRTTSLFRNTIRGLAGAFNPYAIAIGLVTSLLVAYASRTTNAEIATRGLSAAQRDAVDAIDSQTAAYERQTKAVRDNRRNVAQQGIEAGQTDLNARRTSLANQVRIFGEYARLSEADRKLVADIGRTIAKAGDASEIEAAYTRLQKIRERNPRANDAGFGFKAGAEQVDTEFTEFAKARARLAFNRQNLRDLERQEREIQKPSPTGKQTPAATAAELRAKAVADAVDGGTDTIRAAGARRSAALKELDREFGVKGGKVDPARAAEYQARAVEIERGYNGEVQAIKDGQKAAAEARRAGLAAAAAERRQERQEEAAEARRIREAASMGEKRSDVLGQYDAAPRAIDRARDQIEDLQAFVDKAVDGVAFVGKTRQEVEAIKKINPLGRGIYTQEMADADARNIERGVQKPIEDLFLSSGRQQQINDLIVQGLEDQATAYERAFSAADDVGEVTGDQYRRILDNVRAENAQNAALERRQRIVDSLQSMVGDAREATQDLIVSLGEGGGFRSIGQFFRSLQRSYLQAFARQITEKVFAGADEKVQSLINSRAPVDQAVQFFSGKLAQAGQAAERVANALDGAADRMGGGTGGIAGTENVNPLAIPSTPMGGMGGIFNMLAAAVPAVAKIAGNLDEDIVVSGKAPPPRAPVKEQEFPNAREVGKTIYTSAGDFLDKTFKTGTFFKGVGTGVSKALQGSATGQFASGIARSVGIKQSGTGSAIGGALGGLTGIPGMGFIGGLIGGTIGGLFKKAKTGSATIGANAFGSLDISATGGNNAALRKQSSRAADSLIGAVEGLAQQLGGTIDPSRANVSIGLKDGKYRVDTTGRGNVKTKRGAVDFGDDEQAAIEFAIRDLVMDGVITGISAASQNILRAGRNLQVQIEKAALIESIPRRLMQRTDPVRFAVEELNREFGRMIAALKEGGATTQQFADAQKLYDLERAEAIKNAAQASAEAIDQFLKDMVGGSNSPLNRRTTYQNASTALEAFRADVQGGKVVDQNEILQAARNFQEASRALNGSGAQFFADFDSIFALLSKARDNAGITNVTNLPSSPFSTDQGVQAAITAANNNQVGAIQTQTAEIVTALNSVRDAVQRGLYGNGYTSGGGGAFGALPIARER